MNLTQIAMRMANGMNLRQQDFGDFVRKQKAMALVILLEHLLFNAHFCSSICMHLLLQAKIEHFYTGL